MPPRDENVEKSYSAPKNETNEAAENIRVFHDLNAMIEEKGAFDSEHLIPSPNNQPPISQPMTNTNICTRSSNADHIEYSNDGTQFQSPFTIISAKRSKSLWTPQEDALLKSMIGSAKNICWRKVAFSMGSRNAKQCRERWKNHISPHINTSPLTDSEKAVILELQSKIGNKWSVIAAKLRDRTENAVKNFFYLHKRKVNKKRNKTEEPKIYEAPKSDYIFNDVLALKLPDFTNEQRTNVFPKLEEPEENLNSDLFSSNFESRNNQEPAQSVNSYKMISSEELFKDIQPKTDLNQDEAVSNAFLNENPLFFGKEEQDGVLVEQMFKNGGQKEKENSSF